MLRVQILMVHSQRHGGKPPMFAPPLLNKTQYLDDPNESF